MENLTRLFAKELGHRGNTSPVVAREKGVIRRV